MRFVVVTVALVLLWSLSGCGGGTVVFQNGPQNEVLVSPYPILQKLEASISSEKQTTSLLEALNDAQNHKFDWSLFWLELSKRPFAKQLYKTHGKTLLKMHSQHCDPIPSFARFWMSVDGDLSALVTGERCNQALSPELVTEISRSLLPRLDASVSDEMETRTLLLSIKDAEPNQFDWSLLWSELSKRPYRKDFYQKQSETLYELQSLHCDAFSSFSQFWLSVDGDLNVLIGDKRRCAQAIPPDVAAGIVSTASRNPLLSPELLKSSLQMIVDGIQGDKNSDRWEQVAREKSDALEVIGRRLVSQGEGKYYWKAVVQLRATFKKTPFFANAFGDLLDNPKAFQEWLGGYGFPESVNQLSVFSNDLSDGFVLSTARGENLVSGLESLFAGHEINDSFARGLETSFAVLKKLTSSWPLSSRLLAMNRFLSISESRLAALPKEVRETLLADWILEFRHSDAAASFYWLGLRFLDTNNKEIAEVVVPDLMTEQRNDSDSMDRLSWQIDRLFVSDPSQEAKKAVDAICQVMAENGIAMQRIGAAELQAKLEQKLAPGCYQLEGQGDRIIRSQRPLSATFASLISVRDGALSFTGKEVSLGPVFMITTKHHPRQVSSPVPPEANAIAFPLLVGMTLSQESQFFKQAGTYFFIYQYGFRKAAGGAAEPNPPLVGFPGADLDITSETAFLNFPFVSLGGPGQQGAPERSGGLGDSSSLGKDELGQISFLDNIENWLSLMKDKGRLAIKGLPFLIKRGLSLDRISDLASKADRDAQGNLLLFTVPAVIDQWPDEQKEKIFSACRIVLSKSEIGHGDLETCLTSHLVKSVAGELESLLQRSAKDGSLRRTDILPQLKPTEEFVLPSGAMGPKNRDGAAGISGKLRIRVSKEEKTK